MKRDVYTGFAERYDRMKTDDPSRRDFFARLVKRHALRRVLDCACGTGRDLLLFQSLGCEVRGSDLSDAMLAQAKGVVAESGAGIVLGKADYRDLAAHHTPDFDAVLCLGNSINEVLDDGGTLRALRGMKSVLKPGGLLIFDQGQTDASMADPPTFAPIMNSRDFSRLLTMSYAADIMTVNIFDFIHEEDESDFARTEVRIRIRLMDSWRDILAEAGFRQVRFHGDWRGETYDKAESKRLICVAEKH